MPPMNHRKTCLFHCFSVNVGHNSPDTRDPELCPDMCDDNSINILVILVMKILCHSVGKSRLGQQVDIILIVKLDWKVSDSAGQSDERNSFAGVESKLFRLKIESGVFLYINFLLLMFTAS